MAFKSCKQNFANLMKKPEASERKKFYDKIISKCVLHSGSGNRRSDAINTTAMFCALDC